MTSLPAYSDATITRQLTALPRAAVIAAAHANAENLELLAKGKPAAIIIDAECHPANDQLPLWQILGWWRKNARGIPIGFYNLHAVDCVLVNNPHRLEEKIDAFRRLFDASDFIGADAYLMVGGESYREANHRFIFTRLAQVAPVLPLAWPYVSGDATREVGVECYESMLRLCLETCGRVGAWADGRGMPTEYIDVLKRVRGSRRSSPRSEIRPVPEIRKPQLLPVASIR